jgi:hypothetical protein
MHWTAQQEQAADSIHAFSTAAQNNSERVEPQQQGTMQQRQQGTKEAEPSCAKRWQK